MFCMILTININYFHKQLQLINLSNEDTVSSVMIFFFFIEILSNPELYYN
jgi:hypothetical protein